jgi:hypothetical protein
MLGFEWSNIGLDYIQKYVLYFRKLGYFGEWLWIKVTRFINTKKFQLLEN